MRTLVLLNLIAVFSACASGFSLRRAAEISVPALQSRLRTDTTDHIVYVGSDATWHYFYHSELFGGGSYKVPKAILQMPAEMLQEPNSSRQAEFLDGRFTSTNGNLYEYRPYLPQHRAH